jgi:lipoprotein signal peptidase
MKKWPWLILAFILVISIAGEFMSHHESHHWWSHIPLFYMILGAVGSVLLIIFCKFLLIHLIVKHEDYYDAVE